MVQSFRKDYRQAKKWLYHHTIVLLIWMVSCGTMFWRNFPQYLIGDSHTYATWSADWCNVNSGAIDIPYRECQALSAMYAGMNGSGWGRKDNRFVTTSICGGGTGTYMSTGSSTIVIQSWSRYGISNCSSGSIRGINFLRNSNMSFVIPTEIQNLTQLQYLNLESSYDTWGYNINALDNMPALEELYLGNNWLLSLPTNIGNLTGLRTLDVKLGGITTLPTWIDNLTQLRFLNMYGNALTGVPADIGNLANLQTLWLFNNDIASLPTEFGNLTGLKTLRLSNNNLTSLPATFGNLTGLTYIDLQSNLLTSLPTTFGNLVNLQTWIMYNNQITSIPTGFGNLRSIRHLMLNNNLLTSLPAEFGSLSALISLSLQDNQLTTVPAEFGSLSGLQTLYLQNNNITSLPAEFGNLYTLQTLNLSYNLLTGLTTTFSNLSGLQTLSITNNLLITLPTEFSRLSGLQTLYLQYNDITSLPATFGSLSWLQVLYLDYNDLTELPTSFGNLSTLDQLYLSNNQLQCFRTTINNLTGLQYLSLANNNLTSLPVGIGDLTSLTFLDLSYNDLTELPSQIGNLTGLTYVNLSTNHLTVLPTEIINRTALSFLNIEYNQITGSLNIWIYPNVDQLWLDNNQLYEITGDMANLPWISILFLGNNHLTTLPSSLSWDNNIVLWGNLDVSYNCLEAVNIPQNPLDYINAYSPGWQDSQTNCTGVITPRTGLTFDTCEERHIYYDTGSVLGCTNSGANNYNSWANIDNGSCTYDVLWCTDVGATNYNSWATINTWCIYPVTPPSWCTSNCGWSSYTPVDVCPAGDYSTSFYDGICGTAPIVLHHSAKINSGELGQTEGKACIYSDVNYLDKWPFTDTINHRWYPYIEMMRLSCIQKWVGSSQWLRLYGPETQITRWAVLKTIVKILWIAFNDFSITSEDQPYYGETPFKDVPRDLWVAHYAEYAQTKWLTDGLIAYDAKWNAYIKPDEPMTRYEAIKVMMVAYNMIVKIKVDISWRSALGDVIEKNNPYYQYIRQAEILWFISWIPQVDRWYNFEWQKYITRAEFAKIISVPFGDELFDIESIVTSSSIYQTIMTSLTTNTTGKKALLQKIFGTLNSIPDMVFIDSFKIQKKLFLDTLKKKVME